MNLELTEQEIKAILQVLGQVPYNQVVNLIQKILKQVNGDK